MKHYSNQASAGEHVLLKIRASLWITIVLHGIQVDVSTVDHWIMQAFLLLATFSQGIWLFPIRNNDYNDQHQDGSGSGTAQEWPPANSCFHPGWTENSRSNSSFPDEDLFCRPSRAWPHDPSNLMSSPAAASSQPWMLEEAGISPSMFSFRCAEGHVKLLKSISLQSDSSWQGLGTLLCIIQLLTCTATMQATFEVRLYSTQRIYRINRKSSMAKWLTWSWKYQRTWVHMQQYLLFARTLGLL